MDEPTNYCEYYDEACETLNLPLECKQACTCLLEYSQKEDEMLDGKGF